MALRKVSPGIHSLTPLDTPSTLSSSSSLYIYIFEIRVTVIVTEQLSITTYMLIALAFMTAHDVESFK